MAKPVVTKKQPVVPNHNEDIFDSAFAVPPQVMKEIKEKGYACRWINGTTLQKGFGFNKNRWVPFKSEFVKSSIGSLFGGDPEGYVRRGDLVLAVKPKELQDKHKAFNAQKIALSKGDAVKKRKEEMRAIAEEHNVKSKIESEYEEENE